MHARLSGKPLQEVDCFKYLGSQVEVGGGCERDVLHQINEGYIVWGVLRSVLSNRGLGKNVKCPYDEIIAPTVLYGTNPCA